MAADNAVRFDSDTWSPGPYGLPLLHDVTAWMIGRIVEVIPVHKNAIVAIEIESGGLGPEDHALLYHERQYHRPHVIDGDADESS